MKISLIKKVLGAFAVVAALSFAGCSCGGGADGSSSSSSGGSTGGGNLTAERLKLLAPDTPGPITVDGVTYPTLQAALDAAGSASPDFAFDGPDNSYVTIELSPGTYNVKGLQYNGSRNIHLKGTGTAEYGADVLITGIGSDMAQESYRSVLEIRKGNWIIENLVIRNEYTAEGDCQAEALGHQSGGTLAVRNCAFLSKQDTIRTQGKAWFYKCYVEGDVDFLWMETPGKVALYEDCRLRAVAGRTKGGKQVDAYFAAPRASSSLTEVNKGLVIYKSKLEVEDGMGAYLGRNPWADKYSKDYFNQVAIVKTELFGSLNSALWKGNANGVLTPNQKYVGFKTDMNFAASTDSSIKAARISNAEVENEFSSRAVIFNRRYNLNTSEYENESNSACWDGSALAAKWGAGDWGTLPVPEFDSSKAKVVWDLSSAWTGKKTDNTDVNKFEGSSGTLNGVIDGSDEVITMHVNGQNGKFASDTANSRTQINGGTVLTVPVTDGAIVSVTSTSGTYGIEGEKRTSYTHSGDATGVIIYCTANGYITELSVSNLDVAALSAALKNATATGETKAIAFNSDEVELMNGNSTNLTPAIYTSYGATADSVIWTSSNPTVVDVDTAGKVTAKADSGTSTITAKTAGGLSATCVVKAKPASSVLDITYDLTSTTSLTWYTDAACTTPLGKTGKTGGDAYISTSDGVPMYFKADTADGKLSTQGGTGSQFYNASLYIPVSADSIVTVKMHSNQTGYSHCELSGTRLTAKDSSYTVSGAGYVKLSEVDANTGTYIISVSVTNVNKNETRSVTDAPVTVTAN